MYMYMQSVSTSLDTVYTCTHTHLFVYSACSITKERLTTAYFWLHVLSPFCGFAYVDMEARKNASYHAYSEKAAHRARDLPSRQEVPFALSVAVNSEAHSNHGVLLSRNASLL